ncbi:SID1 transmembrane family member 2 isoform X5 [Phyllopteryx taeniolatus]|uniref:SID1 transmembrane family member 2 isoform X5 n=1 Tax=Phyllopteryx taeniolatus TaxID=161469 RepID=UPI002AD33CAC|nr:SID1 transmembrane family member 2 isoform X5 [Phyllopteryx taeniolatus]
MLFGSHWKSRYKNTFEGAAAGVLLCFFVALLACVSGALGETKNVIQKDGEFDVSYNDTVTSENQTIYAFNHTVSRTKTEGVRVSVDVLSQNLQSPILFVIRQKQAVLSFQVPLILRGLYQRKYPYNHLGRTLCQPPTRAASETQYFFVDVSTLSSQGTNYQLRVSRVESFTLQTDTTFSFTASPSQPQYFKYVFPEGVDTVIVKVSSDMTFPCSVMSIQDIQCPVYDLDNNVAFIGMYQTMTKKGAITVQRKDFPSNSFYVVVVVKTEDEACGGPLRFYPLRPDELIDAGNRSKTLNVVVSPAIKSEVYVMGMLFCLGIFLSFYLLTLLVACLEKKRAKRRELFQNIDDTSPAETASLLGKNGDGQIAATPNEYGSLESTISSEAITDSAPSVDSATSADNYMGREPFKRRPILNQLHHTAICIERSVWKNVGRSRQESLSSIEEDDYDTLDDINSDKNIVRTKECGIPKHFGLFYAMGTALMMEGLLSACYHVCPNYTNFQFDTSFMYMIAGLCMLKLYQKRHPDINASAYTAYACLAAVIFFSVLGVVFGRGNTVFWIVFSVIHILATLLLSTQLYYMGRWRLDSGVLRRMVYVVYTDCIRQCTGPMYIDRMVLLVMGNIVNWSLAAYGLIERPSDFASYLLAIAICNLLLYFAFYIIMKLRSGEAIQCLAMVCILFTAVVWGFALYFFFQGLSTWQKTPAESREHNRDCILLSFFDDHDIWHFLSSIAMFGSFLVLLTMDDDLDTVQRDKIYVF